jgi:hypothetical protein
MFVILQIFSTCKCENMQIEHVHLLVNMQKCTCNICNFGNLVILHICKHVLAILVIIMILN